MGAVTVHYPGTPLAVRFLARPNRYLARVRPLHGGSTMEAHVPNPGRMEELLVPKETLGYVIPASNPERRTRFDLVSVRHGRELVSIDSRIGNRLVGVVLTSGGLKEAGPGPWVPEFSWGGHRLDFAIPPEAPGGAPRALLEVKCSNLKVGDRALFPDAPTLRGTAHVKLLTRMARAGTPSTVLFVVQRDSPRGFAANGHLDPAFAEALTEARRSGVLVLAHTVRVRPGRVDWGRRIRCH